MPVTNPLSDLQRQSGASFITYGDGDDGVELVETFGEYEAEYAAIRKGVGIMDMAQRGVVAVRGGDALGFMQAMVTNDTSPEQLGPMRACRAFLLSKQGRIDADMIVCRFDDDACYLSLDRCDAPRVVAELDKYLFTEDAQLEDVSGEHHHIALHGPAAAKLVERVASASLEALEPYQCAMVTLADRPCRVYRCDDTGAPGLHLLVNAPGAAAVYQQLADALGELVPDVEGGQRRDIVGRAIGWLAYNTSRIEAGAPLYHVDFGPDTLPHETGMLHQAVSFTKGCYLGQEIVARMENLGHPKRTVVALRCEGQALPIAGSQVFDDDGATVIGAVTSSTLSPMLGHTPIALAMIRWGKHQPDTQVKVPADGRIVSAKTHALAFV